MATLPWTRRVGPLKAVRGGALHCRAIAFGTALLLPLPACGERGGVRGPLHRLRLAERSPHPARKSAPTSPRKRGEVKVAAKRDCPAVLREVSVNDRCEHISDEPHHPLSRRSRTAPPRRRGHSGARRGYGHGDTSTQARRGGLSRHTLRALADRPAGQQRHSHPVATRYSAPTASQLLPCRCRYRFHEHLFVDPDRPG